MVGDVLQLRVGLLFRAVVALVVFEVMRVGGCCDFSDGEFLCVVWFGLGVEGVCSEFPVRGHNLRAIDR